MSPRHWNLVRLIDTNRCNMTVSPPVLRPLPDPPRRKPDELMANFKHLTINGCALHLARHFGHPETALLGGDLYLAPFPPH